jgi:hypothetical protein
MLTCLSLKLSRALEPQQLASLLTPLLLRSLEAPLPPRLPPQTPAVRHVAAGSHLTVAVTTGGRLFQMGATGASAPSAKHCPWEGATLPELVRGQLAGVSLLLLLLSDAALLVAMCCCCCCFAPCCSFCAGPLRAVLNCDPHTPLALMYIMLLPHPDPTHSSQPSLPHHPVQAYL